MIKHIEKTGIDKKTGHNIFTIGCPNENGHGAFHEDGEKMICTHCNEDITKEARDIGLLV